MVDVDDYVTGHENDITRFDYENFLNDISEWNESIKNDLKKTPYDMTLLCINAVLEQVKDIVYNNTEIYNPYS